MCEKRILEARVSSLEAEVLAKERDRVSAQSEVVRLQSQATLAAEERKALDSEKESLRFHAKQQESALEVNCCGGMGDRSWHVLCCAYVGGVPGPSFLTIAVLVQWRCVALQNVPFCFCTLSVAVHMT